MSDKELGTTGFYLYSYLKMKNQFFSTGYDVSLENLEKETRIPNSSLVRYLAALRKYNLIEALHNQEYFTLGLEEEFKKANTYITNDSSSFTFVAQPYKKIEVKSPEEHKRIVAKRKAKEKQKRDSKKGGIDFSDMPF